MSYHILWNSAWIAGLSVAVIVSVYYWFDTSWKMLVSAENILGVVALASLWNSGWGIELQL